MFLKIKYSGVFLYIQQLHMIELLTKFHVIQLYTRATLN